MFQCLKRFIRQSRAKGPSTRPLSCLRPQVESLGSGLLSAGSRYARPHSPRPAVEQLEERELLTAWGNITGVVDAFGKRYDYGLGGQDQAVWQHTTSGWEQLGASWGFTGPFTQVSAGRDQSGHAEVFAIGPGQKVYRYDYIDNAWGSLGGSKTFTQITTSNFGGISGTVFALASGHAVWEWDQSGWHNLGGNDLQISAISDHGTPVVYGIDSFHHVLKHVSTGWKALGTKYVTQISAAEDASAGAEVFAIDKIGQTWLRDATAWTNYGGYVTAITSGYNPYGADVVYGLGGNSEPFVHDSTGWHGFQKYDVVEMAGVTSDSLFVVDSSHSTWSHDFGAWTSYGGWLR